MPTFFPVRHIHFFLWLFLVVQALQAPTHKHRMCQSEDCAAAAYQVQAVKQEQPPSDLSEQSIFFTVLPNFFTALLKYIVCS